MTTHVKPKTEQRRVALAAMALLSGLIMLLHGLIPNEFKNLGSLVETFLPWLGALIPSLLIAAIARRSVVAIIALLLPITVWLSLFGGMLLDRSHAGGDLTVVTHNVGAANTAHAGTARTLIDSGADLVALEEMTSAAIDSYEQLLAEKFPFHTIQGSVGLWSKFPLTDSQAVDVKVGAAPPEATLVNDDGLPTRSLRVTVSTYDGPLAVYVAHLGSVGVNPRAGFSTYQRDAGAKALAEAVAADPVERVILVGDLNGVMDDRAFAGLTSQLKSVHDIAGAGFGFTWPSTFPVVRIDQILVRGVDPVRSWVLPPTGSDHRAVAAEIAF